ncbi:MAG: hypothetical protein ACJAZO_005429 [Myxococcota bacterium]|jgi:hypothetical protein
MRKLVAVVALLLPIAASAVPPLLDHQGRLMDSVGTPIEGSHTLTFRLYTTDVGGTAFWSEQQTLPMSDGFFGAKIGNGLDIESLDTAAVWIGIDVDSAGELAGRQRLTSVPYALVADTAERVRCPSDMVDAGAFCIDVDENSQKNWQDAATDCVGEGKRMCGMAEWIGACNHANTLGLNTMTDNLEYVDEYWVMNHTNGNYYSAYVSVGGGSCDRVHYSGWGCANSSCYDTTNPGKPVGYRSRCCK